MWWTYSSSFYFLENQRLSKLLSFPLISAHFETGGTFSELLFFNKFFIFPSSFSWSLVILLFFTFVVLRTFILEAPLPPFFLFLFLGVMFAICFLFFFFSSEIIGDFFFHFLSGFSGFYVKNDFFFCMIVVKHAINEGHYCMAYLVVPLRLNDSIIFLLCMLWWKYAWKREEKIQKECED